MADQQKTYTCSLSGRVYKTKRGALNSEERERRKDYIRLHTTTPQHFTELLVSKGKEFWGWDIEVDIKDSSVSKESYWSNDSELGVQLTLNIIGTFGKKTGRSRYITDVLRFYINGLGGYNRSWHTVSTSYYNGIQETVWLPFSQFPLLSKNYDEYKDRKAEFNKWYKDKTLARSEGETFASKRPDYTEVELEIVKVSEVLNSLLEKKKLIKGYYVEGYESLWRCQNPEPRRDDFLCDAFGWY